MRNSASPWGKGYTGADYRRGLPKGTPDREGDIFIDTEHGIAYQLISGPRGDRRLRNLANGLIRVTSGFEDTLSKLRITPGAAFGVGAHEWKVNNVSEKQIDFEDAQGAQHSAPPAALAKQIQQERAAYARADEERRRARTERQGAVALVLKDAGVEYTAMAYDVNEERGGIVVKGIENRDALPDTLVILAEQDDAIIVGLKSEIEQSLDAKADKVLDEAEVPDLAADEALGEDELKAIYEPFIPLSKREPKKSRVELKTYIHAMDFGDCDEPFTIDDGWEIVEPVQYAMVPSADGSVFKATFVRYITLKRVVTE